MTNFILSNLPWFWLIMLVVFVVIEAFTMSLTTIWAALSSLPLIFIAKTGLPFKWQLLIFVLLTLLLIIFTRPFAVKKLKLGRDKTNVNDIEGQEILVTKSILQFQKGEAKSKNGVIWTVTSADGTEIPENTVCIVTKVQGNTLEIKPKQN